MTGTESAPQLASAAFERAGTGGSLKISGRLDAAGVGAAWKAFAAATSAAGGGSIAIDAGGVTYCDGSGVGAIAAVVVSWKNAGGSATVTGLKADQQRLVDMASATKPVKPETPRGFVESAGLATIDTVVTLVRLIDFTGRVILLLLAALMKPSKIRWPDALHAFYKTGVTATPVVCLLCFLVGAIIAFQTIGPMSQYGAKLQVSQVVGVAVIRELGPLITAIILAGRSGSAFAAEIGTMRVTQEIDALSTFGLDPVRFLVVPRMLAAMVATPLLAAFGNLLGLAGGGVVVWANGFTVRQYLDQIQSIVTSTDYLQGLVKAFVFAILVGGTGCYCGLRTKEGPGAVGDSTTRSVVAGIVLIIAADAILGAFFHEIGI